MKNFLLFLGFISAISCFSQESYILTNAGDTLKGKINFFMRGYYDEVEVKTKEGRKSFKSYQIAVVSIDDSQYIPFVHNNRRVIGKLISDGALSHYAIMEKDVNGFGTEVLLKKDLSTLVVSNLGFRKRIVEFLSECESLAKKIENKEIAASNLKLVTSTYNQTCGNEVTAPFAPNNDSIEISPSDSKLVELAQLIVDIQRKVDAKEKVPSYMIEALKSYDPAEITTKLKQFTSIIEKKR